MITTDAAVKSLVRIAEAVALQECEAKQHGQEPCPVQFDDQEHWCRRAWLARRLKIS